MVTSLKIPSPTAFNAIVGPGGYATISEACTAEDAGAVIAVMPGTYAEIADIAPRLGQSIVAYGGLCDLIWIEMGNNILDLSNSYIRISGLYFNFAATTDKSFVNIFGDGCLIEDCVFSFSDTLASAHSGVYVSADGVHLSHILIAGALISENPLLVEASRDCLFEHITIDGFSITAGKPSLVVITQCQKNVWNDININMAFATTGGSYINVLTDNSTTYDPCQFSNIRIIGNNGLGDNGILYDGGTGPAILKGDQWTNVSIEGCNYALSIVYVANLQFENLTIGQNYLTADGITIAGADNLHINNCIVNANGNCLITSATEANSSVFFSNCFFTTLGADCITLDGFAAFFAFSNIYAFGAVNIIDSAYVGWTNCTLFGAVVLDEPYGTDHMFQGCYVFGVTLDTDYTRWNDCYLFTVDIGAVAATENQFTGCYIQQFSNLDNAVKTIIAGCFIGAFMDKGSDTIRDTYTMYSLPDETTVTARGSMCYDDLGTVHGGNGAHNEIDLPDPAVVQVSKGFRFKVLGVDAGSYPIRINQSALQYIQFDQQVTVPGPGDYLELQTDGAVVELVYVGSDLWVVTCFNTGVVLVPAPM